MRWPEKIGHAAWYSYQRSKRREKDDEDGSTIFPRAAHGGGAAGSGAWHDAGRRGETPVGSERDDRQLVAAAKYGRGPVSGAKTPQELENEIARLRKELAE